MNIFTEQQMTHIRSAILSVWQQIGHDIEVELGDDNEAAIEGCLDADRLRIFGHHEVHRILFEAMKDHGYTKVMKVLVENVILVGRKPPKKVTRRVKNNYKSMAHPEGSHTCPHGYVHVQYCKKCNPPRK